MNLVLDLNSIELTDVQPIGVQKARQQIKKMLDKHQVDQDGLLEIVKRNSGAVMGLFKWSVDFIKAYDQSDFPVAHKRMRSATKKASPAKFKMPTN